MSEAKNESSAESANLERLVMCQLRPMSEAPRDGTEILAYHKDGKNFHPIIWKDWKWQEGNYPRWGMRWSEAYSTQDGFYSGWIPYPTLDT
jgi:hypothetical protein